MVDAQGKKVVNSLRMVVGFMTGKGSAAVMRLIVLPYFLLVPTGFAASQTGLQGTDPYASHFAFEVAPPQTWRAILGWLYRDMLKPVTGSAQPRGYWSKLYDGESGKIEDPSSFLVFDGKYVALDITLPSWRSLNSVALTAHEPRYRPGATTLTILREGSLHRLSVSRHWVDGVATYRASGVASRGARLRLEYQAGGPMAELGELYLDDLGKARSIPAELKTRTITDWRATIGHRECDRVMAGYEKVQSAGQGAVLARLLGDGSRFKTRWVGHNRVPDSENVTHSLIFQVDDTGDPRMDLVRAWLVTPSKAPAQIPWVVLPHQGHVFAALEPLGVGGERELALGPRLTSRGVAVLALDSIRFGDRHGFSAAFYETYPHWSYTGKELDSIRRVMDIVLMPEFQATLGINLDDRNIGIWGYSYGAWISMLAGLIDQRFRAVAFSSFHYRDDDIAYGLSYSLYIPQLSCPEKSLGPPLSIPALLRENNGRAVLAVASDRGLWQAWNQRLPPEVKVVINPYGHTVSESERDGVVNFLMQSFGISPRATIPGAPPSWLTNEAALMPYIESENLWRTRLLKALAKGR